MGGGGKAGFWPDYFSSGLIFLIGLAQESWRDLATMNLISLHPHHPKPQAGRVFLANMKIALVLWGGSGGVGGVSFTALAKCMDNQKTHVVK